jgi:hypothetical protein
LLPGLYLARTVADVAPRSLREEDAAYLFRPVVQGVAELGAMIRLGGYGQDEQRTGQTVVKDRWFYGLILCCLAAAAALTWSLREPLEVGRHVAPDATVSRR